MVQFGPSTPSAIQVAQPRQTKTRPSRPYVTRISEPLADAAQVEAQLARRKSTSIAIHIQVQVSIWVRVKSLSLRLSLYKLQPEREREREIGRVSFDHQLLAVTNVILQLIQAVFGDSKYEHMDRQVQSFIQTQLHPRLLDTGTQCVQCPSSSNCNPRRVSCRVSCRASC